MARSIQRPLVGQVAKYDGVYRPHWECGHIAVRVSRARKLLAVAACAVVVLAALWLGFIGSVEAFVVAGILALIAATPSEERWEPCFPLHFEGGLDDGVSPI